MEPIHHALYKDCDCCHRPCRKEMLQPDGQLLWDHAYYSQFPIKISRCEYRTPGIIFDEHWHRQLQLIYCESGEAVMLCQQQSHAIKPGELLVINSNEMHYGTSDSEHLVYHMIKMDFAFLLSGQADLCQTQYITPLLQGRIRFHNHIKHDAYLVTAFQNILREYTQRQIGCEMAIKGYMYQMLVHLLRHYQQKVLGSAEFERQQKHLQQLQEVLDFVDSHYQQTIRLADLAERANMSQQHFCRVFKQVTGKRPMDYVNFLRMNKASALLAEKRWNITEVAMAVGFDDSNYFSRLFKKYKRVAPSDLLK